MHSFFGEALRTRREELGISMGQLAREMKIAPRFIEALEQGDYDKFPAKVYAVGFVERALEILVREDEELRQGLIATFGEEWRASRGLLTERQTGHQQRFGRFTAVHVLAGSVMLAGGLFLALLLARLETFVGAPALVIDAPAEGEVFMEPGVSVRGRTDREVYLTVNGLELTMDESGLFWGEVALTPGINGLEFMAKNRFGKITREMRYVVAQ